MGGEGISPYVAYHWLTYRRHDLQNKANNMSIVEEQNSEPVYLGIEGERWDYDLPGLVIPTPIPMYHIVVLRGRDGYAVVTSSKWLHTDSLLMAAAWVHDILRTYDVQTEQGPEVDKV